MEQLSTLYVEAVAGGRSGLDYEAPLPMPVGPVPPFRPPFPVEP